MFATWPKCRSQKFSRFNDFQLNSIYKVDFLPDQFWKNFIFINKETIFRIWRIITETTQYFAFRKIFRILFN